MNKYSATESIVYGRYYAYLYGLIKFLKVNIEHLEFLSCPHCSNKLELNKKIIYKDK